MTIDAITHVPLEGVELRRWREAQVGGSPFDSLSLASTPAASQDAARLAAQRAADAARVAAEEAAELVPESMDMHERPPAAPNVVVSVHAAGAASPAAAGKPASAASATTATTSSDQQQQQQQSSSSLLGKRSRPDSVQSQSDVKGASPAAPSSATTTTSTTTADPAEEPDPTAAAASDLEFDFVFEYTDDEAEAGDDGSTARGPLLVDDMAAFRPPRAIAAAAYALANDAEALVKSGGKPTLLALSTGTTTAPSPSAAAPASLASAAARAGGLAARFPMFQRDDSALRACCCYMWQILVITDFLLQAPLGQTTAKPLTRRHTPTPAAATTIPRLPLRRPPLHRRRPRLPVPYPPPPHRSRRPRPCPPRPSARRSRWTSTAGYST